MHRQAALGSRDERVHDRCEAGDRAAAQVVAVGEPSGQDDRVDPLEVGVAVPEGDRLGADGTHGAGRITVVERARERDDPDLHWSGSCSCALTPDAHDVLDHGVGEQLLGRLGSGREVLVGHLAVDGEDEPLALPHVGELLEAEPGKRPVDGLTLGVEDLWLQHDVDDDVAHSGVSWVQRGGAGVGKRRAVYPRPSGGYAARSPPGRAVRALRVGDLFPGAER